MKRICFFCETWESGGIESFLDRLLLNMNLSDMETDIVAASMKESVFTSGLKSRGIRFVSLSGKTRDLRANYGMFRDLLRKRKYDIVYFNLFHGLALYYVRIARQEGIPVRIVHSHGMGLRDSKTKPLKLLLHQFGKHCWSADATDFRACSRGAAAFLFPERVLRHNGLQIIPNGIETKLFRYSSKTRAQVREQLNLDDQLLVGTVGRLSPEKNHKFLLDVFMHIHAQRPNSRLLIVGEGTLMAPLHSYAQELGIGHDVIFYGTSQTVENLLCAMDIFIFPSLMEGLGIAAVEAQASGLPVLCSDKIPEEAWLTHRLKALSLERGADTWAQAALSLLKSTRQREAGADEVRAAGFDISSTVYQVEQMLKMPKTTEQTDGTSTDFNHRTYL